MIDLLPHLPNFPGMIEMGNLEEDGNKEGAQGLVTTLPSGTAILPYGVDMTPEQSIDQFNVTGQHFGMFESPAAAYMYGQNGGTGLNLIRHEPMKAPDFSEPEPSALSEEGMEMEKEKKPDDGMTRMLKENGGT